MSGMVASSHSAVSLLSDDQCWERLAAHSVGRLVTRVRDFVDIFPVNYAVDGDGIVIRTAEGNKLAELVISEEVLFESDQVGELSAWSVIVRGRARVLTSDADIARAEALPLRPLVPTVKRNYVRIEAESISGRWFAFSDEPDSDPVHDHG